ncbi:hypothetical protein C2G38_2149496 [Gigaspora rosea]|uniref:Uncharacterized protein n=1 Tax=Gigaspora rosea TaxID=44941 RepID=A0A397U381_9GLOM|nr:hypothetical protein C2G38_2149496 [Gigaspora rosea]
MIYRNDENDRNDENVNAIQELRELQKKKYDNLRSKDQKLFDSTFIIVGLVFFVNVTINFSYLIWIGLEMCISRKELSIHFTCRTRDHIARHLVSHVTKRNLGCDNSAISREVHL